MPLYDYTYGVKGMRVLLDREPAIDGVFAASDAVAAGALEVLRETGRSVPGDVGIVGFDDSSWALRTQPPLSTVHQPATRDRRRTRPSWCCGRSTVRSRSRAASCSAPASSGAAPPDRRQPHSRRKAVRMSPTPTSPSTPQGMPSLDGAVEWLNSAPLAAAELRGHVVLVDFWTLTCINWLRTQPYVRAWSQAYRDDGLVVIGVHTPEFSFEHEIDGVRRATAERGIDYPVVVDNDYAIWTAFDNHYWPALYFVDADGVIRDRHFGEGRYEQSERVIQRLLGVERELVPVEGVGVEAEADWTRLRTPETYLGYERGEHFASPGRAAFHERHAYQLPERLPVNHWALAGEWTIRRENVALDRAGGSIAYRFHARDAHLVLFSGAGEPIPFRMLLDGEAPGPSHGVDVDEDGNGTLRDGRLYQLVRQHDGVRERTLEITFLEPGAEAYAFTFG